MTAERTPESLLTAAQQVKPDEPNPANMSAEPEAPPDIEFEWKPVDSWSSNVSHRNSEGESWNAVHRDIEQISGLIRSLEANDRGVPPSEAYARALNVLYDALSGRRHELSVMILKIQGLPAPDYDVPPADSPS